MKKKVGQCFPNFKYVTSLQILRFEIKLKTSNFYFSRNLGFLFLFPVSERQNGLYRSIQISIVMYPFGGKHWDQTFPNFGVSPVFLLRHPHKKRLGSKLRLKKNN